MRKPVILLIIQLVFMTLYGSTPDWVKSILFDEAGREIWEIQTDSPRFTSSPESGIPYAEAKRERDNILLDEFPAFNWSYGCANTAAAMIMGYYDRHGFSHIYSGTTNEGICPLTNEVWGSGECPLAASRYGLDGLNERGHVDDYYVSPGYSGEDPYMTGGWTEHLWSDCIGDFMGTSQYAQGNSDGSTTFYIYRNGEKLNHNKRVTGMRDRDGCAGIADFITARDYQVDACYTSAANDSTGFNVSDFQSEIDTGHPVLILLNSHAMAGVGYIEDTDSIFVYDTWNHNLHTMEWGGVYNYYQHIAVCCFSFSNSLSSVDFNGTPVHGSPPLLVDFTPNTDGFVAVYQWDFNNDGVIDYEGEETSWLYSQSGIYSVSLTVYNYDYSLSVTREDYITANTPPDCTLPDVFQFVSGDVLEINLDDYLYDADGDPLSWFITGLNEIVYENIGMSLFLTAYGGFYGYETMHLQVTDGIDTSTSHTNIFVTQPEDNIIYVPDDYEDIQTAVNYAGDDFYVILRPGTYNENIVFTDKNIVLGSMYVESGEKSYIDETVFVVEETPVISFSTPQTEQEIAGFTFQNGYLVSAVEVSEAEINLHHCNFYYNMNLDGAAVNMENSSGNISYCSFIENFTNNQGGILSFINSNVRLENLSFCNNDSNTGSIICTDENSQIYLMNSIIWQNGGNLFDVPDNCLRVEYCALQENFEGEGNIFTDPLWQNTTLNNLHLQINSPCIDSGNPDSDGDGIDWTQDTDDQDEDGSRKDMGAFPYTPVSIDNNQLNKEFVWLVYPNPVFTSTRNTALHIDFSKSSISKTPAVNIYDIKGRKKKTRITSRNENELLLDLSSLTSGVFILDLSAESGYRERKKILLLK